MSKNELVDNIKSAFELQRKGQYREAIAVLYKVLAFEPDNVEALVQIAYLFYARHDLSVSSEYYEKALFINPSNVTALEGLLNILKTKKEYKKALKIAQRLQELNPTINSFIELLSILCLCGLYEAVLEEYQNSQYTNLKNEFLDFYVGLAYYHFGEKEKATIFLEKAIELNPKNTEALYYLAKIEFENENYQKADELLNSVINQRESSNAYNLKGLIQLHFENYPRAMNNFSYAIKIDNKNSEYFYNLAISCSLCGWKQEAEKNYICAITLEPQNAHYHYTLAYLYYESKNLTKANEELETVFSLTPNMIDAQILKGLIATEENKAQEARLLLEKLDAQAAQNDFLFYALGKTYKQLGLQDKAIANFQKSLNLKPSSNEYLIQLAECFWDKKEYDSAKKITNEIIQKTPQYLYAHILHAKILLKQHLFDEALCTTEFAEKLAPNCDEIYYIKSKIYLNQDDFVNALNAIKKAILLAPKEFHYYTKIANIYSLTKNYEAAFIYFKEILTTFPANATIFIETAKCAEALQDSNSALGYYLKAYSLEPKNKQIITEYTDFLLRIKKHKKALKFLYRIIKHENLNKNESALIPYYDKIKQEYLTTRSFLGKIFYKLFKI